jgi:hypothetical protein
VLVGELLEASLSDARRVAQLVRSEAGLCADDVDVVAFHAGDGQALGPVGRDGGSLLAEQIEQRADLAEREPELTVTAVSDFDLPGCRASSPTIMRIVAAAGLSSPPAGNCGMFTMLLPGSGTRRPCR